MVPQKGGVGLGQSARYRHFASLRWSVADRIELAPNPTRQGGWPRVGKGATGVSTDRQMLSPGGRLHASIASRFRCRALPTHRPRLNPASARCSVTIASVSSLQYCSNC
jgi:hypothetical protein